MKSAQWMFGLPIRLDRDMRVVDGTHRLKAAQHLGIELRPESFLYECAGFGCAFCKLTNSRRSFRARTSLGYIGIR